MVGIHWNKDMLQKLDEIKALSKTSGKILDVGAGDGETFELFDEGWEWSGIDIEPMDDKVIEGDAHQIEFPDKHFDLVMSLGCLHNLRVHELEVALKEIERVGKRGYIMLESYRNEKELFNLQCWALTCESFFDHDEWIWIYKKFGYTGDYEFIYFE